MFSGEHPCPRCGEPTGGAYSEGGLRWAICERCMAEEREASREQREAEELRRLREEEEVA